MKAARRLGLGLAHHLQPGLGIEPSPVGGLAPAGDKRAMIGRDLRLPRIERGDLLFGGAGLLARRSAFSQRRFDLGAARAERRHRIRRDTSDLEHRLLAQCDLITEFADVQGQLLPVDGADLLLELVNRARFEAAPRAILALRRIHDDIVGMQLRVLRPAGPMLEAGDDEIARRLAGHAAAMPHAGRGHMRLDMRERGLHRLPMCLDQPPVARDLGHD